MARRYDFYDPGIINNIDWVSVSFPDSDIATIPEDTGIYRFVCTFQGDRQTMYADISAISAKFGETIRACYVKHVILREDVDADLADMYYIDGLHFEHHQCDKDNAVRHKNDLVAKFKPHYNLIKFVIDDMPIENPFNA